MLVATNLHSDFGSPIATNAQQSLGRFPAWYARQSALKPKARSRPIRFTFEVNRFRAPTSFLFATGGGVAMKLRVLERRSCQAE